MKIPSKTLYVVLVYTLFHILIFCNADDENIVIKTSIGNIIGLKDDKVNVFRGIPYAEPPIGVRRFRPPLTKSPFAYPFEAFNYSAECLQSSLFSTDDMSSRDEDCLYLNLWTPRGSERQVKGKVVLYPVLVWIYGGAFMQGAASKPLYHAHNLASRGIVVVSLNYRLGALGFLVSTPDGLFGNYGLADQKLALQWVQHHISRFSGDPNRVTLFGESAGAMSIGLQYLDQQHAKDLSFTRHTPLFHAIILQSNPIGYKYRSVTVANFIGSSYKHLLDCDDLNCLLSESADELMHVQDTLMATPRAIGDFFTWGPVVTDAAWLREVRLKNLVGHAANVTVVQPIQAIAKVRRAGVPVIIGTNEHEGHVFVYSAFRFRLPKLVYQLVVLSFFRQAAPAVLRMYAHLAKQSASDYRVVLSAIINDYLFRCPNHLYAFLLSLAGSPVYLYEFSLATRAPGYPFCNGLACHTAEIPYVFGHTDIIIRDYSWPFERQSAVNTSILPRMSHSSEISEQLDRQRRVDERVSQLMTDFWANFARYGDPNGMPVVNGYKHGTRVEGGPWWPRLLGELPSTDAVRQIESAFKHDIGLNERLLRGRSSDTNASASETATSALVSRLSSFGGTEEGGRYKGGKFVHMIDFDESTEMNVIERDCTCDFWNKLQYKF